MFHVGNFVGHSTIQLCTQIIQEEQVTQIKLSAETPAVPLIIRPGARTMIRDVPFLRKRD
jgi:hypothetical protein